MKIINQRAFFSELYNLFSAIALMYLLTQKEHQSIILN
jgi:hypothetical protein